MAQQPMQQPVSTPDLMAQQPMQQPMGAPDVMQPQPMMGVPQPAPMQQPVSTPDLMVQQPMQTPPVTTMQPTGVPMPDVMQPQPMMGVPQPAPMQPQMEMPQPMMGMAPPVGMQPQQPIGMPQQPMMGQMPSQSKPFPMAIVAIVIATIAIVICLFIFFGGGKSLTCAGEQWGIETNVAVTFSRSGANKATFEFDFSDWADIIDDMDEFAEEMCDEFDYTGVSCRASKNGDKVLIIVTIDFGRVNEDDLEEFFYSEDGTSAKKWNRAHFKEALEADGMTCS